jgi:hypothetical protein
VWASPDENSETSETGETVSCKACYFMLLRNSPTGLCEPLWVIQPHCNLLASVDRSPDAVLSTLRPFYRGSPWL